MLFIQFTKKDEQNKTNHNIAIKDKALANITFFKE